LPVSSWPANGELFSLRREGRRERGPVPVEYALERFVDVLQHVPAAGDPEHLGRRWVGILA
jgi:hypothetical protein